jgi:hypothetical protein
VKKGSFIDYFMKAQTNPNSFINYDNEASPMVSGAISEEQSILIKRYQ